METLRWIGFSEDEIRFGGGGALFLPRGNALGDRVPPGKGTSQLLIGLFCAMGTQSVLAASRGRKPVRTPVARSLVVCATRDDTVVPTVDHSAARYARLVDRENPG